MTCACWRGWRNGCDESKRRCKGLARLSAAAHTRRMTNPNNPPPAVYRQCACCDRYVRYLSPRGFCAECEKELAEVSEGLKARRTDG